ncbi:hypothetical protein BDW62DRAFT_218661 [Aspergillus aurantiobrunneus]
MSPVEGNAWAQMKARKEQNGDISVANPASEPTPKPSSTRKTSGLDYDAELALPMPKPRHVRPEDIVPAPLSKSSFLSRPNVTKKRSTTEPSLSSTERSSKSEVSEKKKSKVATLRSKFSLKDLGKEFRKEIPSIPSLSSMPRLVGGSGNEMKRASSDGEDQSTPTHNFNEAKLYVPRTRKGDVHPNSAPPQTSEFRDSSSLDKESEDSILSCPSMRTPIKISDDGTTEAQFKHSLVHNADTDHSMTYPHLETLLSDGSSPTARAGECSNTGQPEFIQIQDRVFSMKAENNDTSVPYSPKTPPPPPFIDAAAYSPSVYDADRTVTAKASVSSLHEKASQKSQHPFIVSSSNYKEKKALEEPVDDQLFMNPRIPPIPPLLPNKSRAREEVKSNQGDLAVDEDQYLTGVTSHGGYAPPPPHPDYQNTMTLEQQLASHVDSLHYHVNTAVNKITRSFENSNNWSTDQVLKQVDNMFDLARVINARAVTQAEIMKDLPRLLTDARIQINLAQQETLLVEERMKAFVQQEIAELKTELSKLILSNAGVAGSQAQPPDWKSDSSHLGSHGAFRPGDKRFQHQNKRKSRQMKRDDWNLNKVTDKKKPAAEHNQESKPVPAQQIGATTGKESDQDRSSDSVPTPTAAFRTPKPQIDGVANPVPAKREGSAKLGEVSSGSPKLKAPKLNMSSPKPAPNSQPTAEGSQRKGPENSLSPTSEREFDNQPRSAFSSEDLKNPKKKGGMFSNFRRKGDGDSSSGNRFLRTPRRTKDGKSGSSQASQSPRLAISAPINPYATTANPYSASSATSSNATLTAVGGAQIRREDSPSLIHPALRNAQQRQIMADRERRLAQDNHAQAQGHGHPASGSTSPPLPPIPYDAPKLFDSGMSVSAISSTSSFRGMRNLHYPHPFTSSSLAPQTQEVGQTQYFAHHPAHPHPPLSDTGHGHGHGHDHSQLKFDSAEWYGNGNGPMENNKAGHPGGNFF